MMAGDVCVADAIGVLALPRLVIPIAVAETAASPGRMFICFVAMGGLRSDDCAAQQTNTAFELTILLLAIINIPRAYRRVLLLLTGVSFAGRLLHR